MSSMLQELRKAAKTAGFDGYFIPRSDMFGGEEVRAPDERLAQLTGFTGSAGYAVILQDRAAVFSDSRYTVQLARQLDKRQFEGHDQQAITLSTWLGEGAGGLIIGYDGWTISTKQAEELAKTAKQITWKMADVNLVDACWPTRPAYAPRKTWQMDEAHTGRSAAEKIASICEALAKAGAEAQLITAPDSVNWLLNLRGDDLISSPLHLCFAILEASGDVQLIGAEPALAKHGYGVHSLQEIDALLARYTGKKMLMDKASCPHAMTEMAKAAGIKLVWQADPIQEAKAIKSVAEIAGFRAAHISDAVAFLSFWYWLEIEADLATLREADIAARLLEFREAIPEFICESFPAIVALNSNGAVVHYRAKSGADAALARGGVLLIDSGGHYRFGTTDITRTLALGTLALGTPQADAISAASYVLAAHITLAAMRFPIGTTGAQLDAICRGPLWAKLLDYGHGTGHGVGHVLSVHEGPCSLSKRCHLPIVAGNILSNEPGYYKEGAFGVRLENLVLTRADADGFLCFETLTLVPFDRNLIDASLLSAGQLDWLNAYHAQVYEALKGLVSKPMARWLADKTAPLPSKG